MIIQKECYCGTKLEFEAEDIETISCPKCGRPVSILFPKPKEESKEQSPPRPPRPPRQESNATSSPGDRERAVLENVRGRSCYTTLRELIGVLIGVGYVTSSLFLIGGVAGAWQASRTGASGELIGATLAFGLVSGAVGVILLVALKQAMLLMIDAVDVLVAERTDRLENEGRAAEAEMAMGK